MIRRIELQNYMSHGHSVLELHPGLNVLIGPNNCGKSAVVSALQTLCANETGDYMVRHGSRECRVNVETGEGHTVSWCREKGAVSYDINGRRVDRLNRGTPEDLHDLLRLAKVDAGDGSDSFDVHLAPQKAPIFLLDQSPRRAAIFFASSSDAAHLLEMQKRHREKVKEHHREERRLGARIREHDERLDTLRDVDTLVAKLDDLERVGRRLDAEEASAERLRGLIAKMRDARRRLGVERRVVTSLSTLKEPPRLEETRALHRLSREIVHGTEKAKRQAAVHKALEPLKVGPPQPADKELASLVTAFVANRRQMQQAQARVRELHDLEPLPQMQELEALRAVCMHRQAWLRDQRDHQAVREGAHQDLEQAHQALRRYVDAHPHCPTCGQRVQAPDLLREEGGE